MVPSGPLPATYDYKVPYDARQPPQQASTDRYFFLYSTVPFFAFLSQLWFGDRERYMSIICAPQSLTDRTLHDLIMAHMADPQVRNGWQDERSRLERVVAEEEVKTIMRRGEQRRRVNAHSYLRRLRPNRARQQRGSELLRDIPQHLIGHFQQDQ